MVICLGFLTYGVFSLSLIRLLSFLLVYPACASLQTFDFIIQYS